MTQIAISEIFHSIQGEGLHTGEPTTFIRFQGCSLGCTWCDSRYTWKKDSNINISVEELVERVKQITPESTKWICITGGEPLEQREGFSRLVHSLRYTFSGIGMQIEVETSGLVSLIREGPPSESGASEYIHFHYTDINSWVVDLKCPSSETVKENYWDNYRFLKEKDQLKAVVTGDEDLEFVDEVLEKYPTKAKILISPVVEIHPEVNVSLRQLCAEYCKLRGYRLSLQTHKFIWGSKRGV